MDEPIDHSGETVHYSPRTYLLVLVALLALLAVTVAVAFVDLGGLNLLVALLIAITKALLVALFFMHLRSANTLTRGFSLLGLIWLLIMIGLTISDYLTRIWEPPV